MMTKRLRLLAPTLVGVMLSGPAFGAAGLPDGTRRPIPAAVTTATSTNSATSLAVTAPADGSAGYAQREQAATGLEGFAGGAGVSIYLGGSALLIILLVLLLFVI